MKHSASDSKKRNLSFIGYLLLSANLVAFAALAAADLSNFVSPSMVWEIALFGLAFPYLVFINLAFVLLWILRRRWLFLISLSIILLSWKNINSTVQIRLPEKVSKGKESIKVLSFNSRLFDFYRWSHKKDTRSEIYSLFKEEQPDILCIQEFFSSASRGFNNADTLAKFLSGKNKNYVYDLEVTETRNADDRLGAALFTKYPIVGKGKVVFDLKSHNVCQWTDLLIEKDTVRVFNIHMQSIRFAGEDYKFIQNLLSDNQTEEVKGSLKILNRLKLAFLKRSKQTDQVTEQIHASPYPVIVCGDFNDPPSSYTYQKISWNLMDAFEESGSGFSKTYVGTFPSFRIDYILHDAMFKASGYHTIRKVLSDHYPVTCVLEKR